MKTLIIKSGDAIVPDGTIKTALTERQLYVFDVRSLIKSMQADQRLSPTNQFKPSVLSKSSVQNGWGGGNWLTNGAGLFPFLRYTQNDGWYLDFSRANGDARCYLRTGTIEDNSNNKTKPSLLAVKFKWLDKNASYLIDKSAQASSTHRIFSTGSSVAGGASTIRIVPFKQQIEVSSGQGHNPVYSITQDNTWVTLVIYIDGQNSKIICSQDNGEIKSVNSTSLTANIDSIQIAELASDGAQNDFTPKQFFKYGQIARGSYTDSELIDLYNYILSL